jgi:PPM family protein phosphatase
VTTLRSGSATDVGRVRSSNEDWALENGTLFAVADGLGGHVGGEVASRTAVEVLRQTFFQQGFSTESLTGAVQQANRAVWDRSRQEPGLRGMGTTLTALALLNEEGEQLAVAHVGDSRAYLFRDGRLTQLTHDHSLVEEMVRSGELTTEDAAMHPQRHVVTRALGIESEVDVDVRHLAPLPRDRVLLCSDGLINEIDEQEIAVALARNSGPKQVATELVSSARAHGGNDNITVVVVDVIDDTDRRASPVATLAEPVGAEASPPAGGGRDGPVAGAGGNVSTLAPPANEPAVIVAPPLPEQPREHPVPVVAVAPARRLTLRVVGFLVLLLAVLGVAVLAVWWYANSSYFVGLSGNRVVIYQGRTGGLLWFKPHIVQRTALTTSEVPADRIANVQAGMGEPSLTAARHYVSNLEAEHRAFTGASPPSSQASPATTSPATTTTTGGAG